MKLWGGKGVKAKGLGSCYQTGNQGGWEFVTTSKKLALQVSNVDSLLMQGVTCTFCNYKDACYVNTNEIFVCRLKINHALREGHHRHAFNSLVPFSW